MTPPRFPALLLALAVSLAVCPGPSDARQDPVFGAPAANNFVLPEFTHPDVAGLLETLDRVLVDRHPALSSDEARHTLWTFVRRLQAGRLTPSQEASVLDHLLALGRAYADYRHATEEAGLMVRALTVGKTAPEAAGQDIARQHVQAERVSGQGRGPHVLGRLVRDLPDTFPYYRLMQELYANWPFAILGVETGTRERASGLKAQHGLTYRSWWDGPEAGSDRGPIVSAWNVLGWPTTYVLDANGVVRFVNLRDEDLLKAVRQLLNEHMDHAAETAARDRH